MRLPTKAEWLGAGKWARDEAAEWIVGSWALILGWCIVGVIFFSFLQMDGYFSRGLGEGSGVDPGLFQHIGWMFRLFAAIFLVFAVKLKSMGMESEARWVKILGVVGAIIVVAHAMGFGLKALEGKRANAVAVTEVAQTVTQSNDQIIATLNQQKQSILDTLKVQTDPLNAEISSLDKDGKRNEDLGIAQKERRNALQDAAQLKIDLIDAELLKVTSQSGQHKAESTKDIVTTEKWAPLFVGLAQLFTWNPEPDDWAIYLAGVLFLMFWILFGDSICIYMPHALYKMHLKDAQRKRFSAMGKEGGKTTARRKRQGGKMLQIKHYEDQKTATTADLTEEIEPVEDDDLTEDADDDDQDEPETPKQAAE